MQMEEHQLGSVAVGGGRMGTSETTLIEGKGWGRVSSLQQVIACLSVSPVLTVLHVLEIPRQPQKSCNVLVEEPQQVDRETQLSRKRKLNNLSAKPGLVPEVSGLGV